MKWIKSPVAERRPALVLQAARELRPDLQCSVQFVPGLSDRIAQEVRREMRWDGVAVPAGARVGCFGATAWFEEGPPDVRHDAGALPRGMGRSQTPPCNAGSSATPPQ